VRVSRTAGPRCGRPPGCRLAKAGKAAASRRRGTLESAVSERKHLTPSVDSVPGVHPTRRAGGARRELSERVVFRKGDQVVDGWALNASRSGVRAILEESVTLGAEYDVEVGEATARPGRVVWLQEEKDGAIVGVHYLDEHGRSGSIPDIQALTPPPSIRQGSTPDIQTLAPPHAPPVRIGPPISAAPEGQNLADSEAIGGVGTGSDSSGTHGGSDPESR